MSRRPPPFVTGAPAPLFNRIRNQFIPDAIKRLLGLTAEMGTPQLAPELQMSVELFDDPEFQVLLGGTLWGRYVGGLAAGGAGTQGIVAVVNPTGSGELARVDFAEADNDTGAIRVCRMALSRTGLTTPTDQVIQTRDTRRIGAGVTQFFPPTRIRVESSNAGLFAGGLNLRQKRVAIEAQSEFVTPDKPWFLAPGFSLLFLTDSVNQTTPGWTVWGRTRVVQGTELNIQ